MERGHLTSASRSWKLELLIHHLRKNQTTEKKKEGGKERGAGEGCHALRKGFSINLAALEWTTPLVSEICFFGHWL